MAAIIAHPFPAPRRTDEGPSLWGPMPRAPFLQMFNPLARSGSKPDSPLGRRVRLLSAFQQISHMRHGRARDVLGCSVLRVDLEGKVDADLQEEMLDQSRTIERTLARQDVVTAAQFGVTQGNQRPEQFTQ